MSKFEKIYLFWGAVFGLFFLLLLFLDSVAYLGLGGLIFIALVGVAIFIRRIKAKLHKKLP